jgi:hypothetical protein
MSVGDIFSKTPAGVQEVGARKMKLPPRLRTMLILIDGKQPLFIVKEEAEKVGAPADFLEQLLALALIVKTGTIATSSEGTAATNAPVSAERDTPDESFARFRQAKDFMNVSIVNAMGIKSFFFTLKLERAGNLDDLRGLVDAYKEAIAKASGNAEAEVLTERLRNMLG